MAEWDSRETKWNNERIRVWIQEVQERGEREGTKDVRGEGKEVQ
jgi:hypothetical protein